MHAIWGQNNTGCGWASDSGQEGWERDLHSEEDGPVSVRKREDPASPPRLVMNYTTYKHTIRAGLGRDKAGTASKRSENLAREGRGLGARSAPSRASTVSQEATTEAASAAAPRPEDANCGGMQDYTVSLVDPCAQVPQQSIILVQSLRGGSAVFWARREDWGHLIGLCKRSHFLGCWWW